MIRPDGRGPRDLRPSKIETNVLRHAEGSARISVGDTVVLCAASVEERVPMFLKGTGRGWVTAEYGMLPRSTADRMQREAAQGRQGGRTLEIQRLIGRSLRGVVDLASLGERTILLDCDVIEADGGTRTASVTGASVALHQALSYLVAQEKLAYHPMRDLVVAVSVGIVGSEVALDLCYEEDAKSEVDLNVIMTGSGEYVEIQGTAERRPFSDQQLGRMLEAAGEGCRRLVALEREALQLTPISRSKVILLASHNPGKLRELRLLLEPLGGEVLSPEDVGWAGRTVEDGETLEANALKKAREAFVATGVPSVADDTGLFVDAIDGAPGVRSARYAGEAEDPAANCAKLLSALALTPPEDRGAEFRTVLALVDGDGEYLFRGTCRGRITASPRGSGGFGYDPVFELRELGKTFAELEAEAKNRVSHRGRALTALRRHLEARPGNEGT